MALKLLQKRDIDLKKAVDRQREIAEGAKLAARVDQLRQMEATEMKNLLAFRDKTMKQVLGEIQAAHEELDAIKGELLANKEKLERIKELIRVELEKIKQEQNDSGRKRTN